MSLTWGLDYAPDKTKTLCKTKFPHIKATKIQLAIKKARIEYILSTVETIGSSAEKKYRQITVVEYMHSYEAYFISRINY
ncbi:hypothetical protein RCL_jg26333.t2 [Rhizophagus clarus]|uniref:Uncharacterized protein n=1 Tax=Rhizophagus clarus TaxID=94130 RepID=A0A8H3QE71_9GLOM|nr:hypothetical protein RCL_jg26333.t2 [Rhizophagus clarus]